MLWKRGEGRVVDRAMEGDVDEEGEAWLEGEVMTLSGALNVADARARTIPTHRKALNSS